MNSVRLGGESWFKTVLRPATRFRTWCIVTSVKYLALKLYPFMGRVF
jgi:hypothetical protein